MIITNAREQGFTLWGMAEDYLSPFSRIQYELDGLQSDHRYALKRTEPIVDRSSYVAILRLTLKACTTAIKIATYVLSFGILPMCTLIIRNSNRSYYLEYYNGEPIIHVYPQRWQVPNRTSGVSSSGYYNPSVSNASIGHSSHPNQGYTPQSSPNLARFDTPRNPLPSQYSPNSSTILTNLQQSPVPNLTSGVSSSQSDTPPPDAFANVKEITIDGKTYKKFLDRFESSEDVDKFEDEIRSTISDYDFPLTDEISLEAYNYHFLPYIIHTTGKTTHNGIFEDAKVNRKNFVLLSDGLETLASTPLSVNWAFIQNCFYNEEDGSFIWLNPKTNQPFTAPYYCVETGETLDKGDFYFSKDYESYETLTLIVNVDIYRGMNLTIPGDRVMALLRNRPHSIKNIFIA